MNYKHNIIKERFDLLIDSPNGVKKGSWEIDRNADLLYGITITSDQEEQIYYRGSQKIQINDQELFPEDFETKLLMAGLAVSPNHRMTKVGNVKTGNKRIEVWYKDTDHPKAIFTPYTVSFYFFSKVKPNSL